MPILIIFGHHKPNEMHLGSGMVILSPYCTQWAATTCRGTGSTQPAVCCHFTVHHPARVTVVNLAKMAETGAPLRHVFPDFVF